MAKAENNSGFDNNLHMYREPLRVDYKKLAFFRREAELGHLEHQAIGQPGGEFVQEAAQNGVISVKLNEQNQIVSPVTVEEKAPTLASLHRRNELQAQIRTQLENLN